MTTTRPRRGERAPARRRAGADGPADADGLLPDDAWAWAARVVWDGGDVPWAARVVWDGGDIPWAAGGGMAASGGEARSVSRGSARR